MDTKLGSAKAVIETLTKQENAREAHELRQKLASDGARLGRIVYTRAGLHTVESWEDGNATLQLKKRREVLSIKKEQLEARQKEARKAARRVTHLHHPNGTNVNSSKHHQDGGFLDGEMPVGGLQVQDELDAMEAEESVKLHLSTLKKADMDLAQEEAALNAEKISHIRALKRVASEDSSRFHTKPKLNDRYLLLHLLGKGGFSEVWSAYDLDSLRQVAVKIHQVDPRWSDAKRENYTKHVSREYQIHRDVRHARIVSLFDVFEIDNHSFATVLECCKGTDLDTLLKERKVLPERDARAILLQILDGMRYLSTPSKDGERQGIIHYDLKPGNILFDEFGDAKITDFGLSKIVETGESSMGGDSLELTSQGAGTYWYLPPECFVVDQRVRIIGVIYYQMIFGKRPFGDGQTQDKVLSNNTMLNAREVKYPSKPTVSKDAKDFIQACLTYDQTLRPTISELCQHKYLYQKKIG